MPISSVSPNLSQNDKSHSLFAKTLVEKFDLNEEREKQATNALLVMQAHVNISNSDFPEEYVERLSNFFQHYQQLAKELQRMAGASS